jgi:putative membrane protein insertion efficiency factor
VKLLRRAAAAPIEAYRRVVSPLLPARCKYEPTCSAYAAQAIRQFGILRGLVLAAWRLLRCNPWSHGGFDPVAEQRVFPLRRHFGAHRATKHAGS